jgi:glycerol uptake facilitator-like aquaporin
MLLAKQRTLTLKDEPLSRRLIADGLGTALLVATVVGSGIMAEAQKRMAGLACGLSQRFGVGFAAECLIGAPAAPY